LNGLNPRRLIVVAVIVLAVTTALMYSFRSVIREAVVIPLSYWVWVIGLFLESTPQIFFWVVTILIIFVIAWRSFITKEKLNEAVLMVPDMSAPRGRVSYWTARVNLMRMGIYYQANFNEALARVALDLISYRHRLSNRQIERGLSQKTLRIPDEVGDFLLTNIFRREFKTVRFLTYVYRAVRLWWMSRVPQSRPRRDQLTPEARRVIQYMEEELEVHYDHPGR
jgi:hypothetical protein